MKRLNLLIIFIFVYFFYFVLATRFSLRPIWALEYFNQLTVSLLHGKFDLPSPGSTHDLSSYHGKWYVPYGPLPSLILIPFQILKGRFIPIVYLSVFFASLTVVIMYMFLLRLKKEFFPSLSWMGVILTSFFFAFGTTQFYVGTTSSLWFVEQTISSFFATLGIFIIFKKERTSRDYFFSTCMFALTLLGRATNVLLISLPLFLFLYEKRYKIIGIKRTFFIFCFPLILFSVLFFGYNLIRFGTITEYGYQYIHESPNLEKIRKQNGMFSFKNVQNNIKYMLFEIPSFNLKPKFRINFNLSGNSIFLISPPLLAIFIANPWQRKNKVLYLNPYVMGAWISILVTLIPTLLWYSTGWMQFGYRYTLDVTVLLTTLSVFGIKGKLNILYILGIVFSISIYFIGIMSMW